MWSPHYDRAEGSETGKSIVSGGIVLSTRNECDTQEEAQDENGDTWIDHQPVQQAPLTVIVRPLLGNITTKWMDLEYKEAKQRLYQFLNENNILIRGMSWKRIRNIWAFNRIG